LTKKGALNILASCSKDTTKRALSLLQRERIYKYINESSGGEGNNTHHNLEGLVNTPNQIRP